MVNQRIATNFLTYVLQQYTTFAKTPITSSSSSSSFSSSSPPRNLSLRPQSSINAVSLPLSLEAFVVATRDIIGPTREEPSSNTRRVQLSAVKRPGPHPLPLFNLPIPRRRRRRETACAARETITRRGQLPSLVFGCANCCCCQGRRGYE